MIFGNIGQYIKYLPHRVFYFCLICRVNALDKRAPHFRLSK